MRILYDGWPLAYAALSPAATHLRHLLTAPAAVERLLAAPLALSETLPADIQLITAPARERGEWEQTVLQSLAAQHGASCIHTTAKAASLLGKTPTLVSPAEYTQARRSRMAAARAHGGLSRARLLWPNDLPAPTHAGALAVLPPAVQAATHARLPANTAEEFLLYHGSGQPEVLQFLLDAWTWAAGSIGELYPLLVAGLDEQQTAWLQAQLPALGLQDYVHSLHTSPAELGSLVQHCTAFIHPEPPPAWGSSLRQALAHGKAVVALQEPLTEALAGSAAYLAPAHDPRSLGAAMITVVVEEGLRSTLQQQAAQKSASWSAGAFESELSRLYASLA